MLLPPYELCTSFSIRTYLNVYCHYFVGARKMHGWDLVNTSKDRDISKYSSTSNKTVSAAAKAWEEYWDESAQAVYWYNTTTNEATWIKPSN